VEEAKRNKRTNKNKMEKNTQNVWKNKESNSLRRKTMKWKIHYEREKRNRRRKENRMKKQRWKKYR
jgi:hypothetical protein